MDLELILAATKGDLEEVDALLLRGADVHVADDLPLRGASGNGHLRVVKRLIEAGANIQARSSDALLSALYTKQTCTAKVLLDAGARSDQARVVATKIGYAPALELLETFGL